MRSLLGVCWEACDPRGFGGLCGLGLDLGYGPRAHSCGGHASLPHMLGRDVPSVVGQAARCIASSTAMRADDGQPLVNP